MPVVVQALLSHYFIGLLMQFERGYTYCNILNDQELAAKGNYFTSYLRPFHY